MKSYRPTRARRVENEQGESHSPWTSFASEWVTFAPYEMGYLERERDELELRVERCEYWYPFEKSITRSVHEEMIVSEKISESYPVVYQQLRLPWAVGVRLLRSYANGTLRTREVADRARVIVGAQHRREGFTIVAPCGQAYFVARVTALSLVDLVPQLRKEKS